MRMRVELLEDETRRRSDPRTHPRLKHIQSAGLSKIYVENPPHGGLAGKLFQKTAALKCAGERRLPKPTAKAWCFGNKRPGSAECLRRQPTCGAGKLLRCHADTAANVFPRKSPCLATTTSRCYFTKISGRSSAIFRKTAIRSSR